jgi:superfamily I DNA and RNA helicase
MINTVWGTTSKPVASKQLSDLLERMPKVQGTLYVGYPVIGTPDGPFPFDAVLMSPEKGLVVFQVIEGKTLGAYEQVLDESFTKLQAKLLQYNALTRKRQLSVQITTVAFAPAVVGPLPVGDENHLVANLENLVQILDTIEWATPDLYPQLAASLQAISTIRKSRKRRELKKPDSLGARLKRIEDSIANLDSNQSAAVVETVDGVQRLRGLAGSGKTIVLALKVAYLHARQPDWRIAVTFNTRSLKGQFERLINTFVIEQTSDEPDWDRIDIVNAWGAPGGRNRDGIYCKFCVDNDLEYLDFKSAEALYGANKAFAGVCDKVLTEVKNPKEVYDAILVDEAQDFSPSFLRLCYLFLKNPKRLVYAYDELQSLTGNSLPPPEEIFGTRPDGSPIVSFAAPHPGVPKQDIILDKCYRNSRPLLATAHALGFGIYREPGGLIQLFDQKDLWLDVGYVVERGTLADDQFVSLERTPETSPLFLENHSAVDELVQFRAFKSEEEQTNWLVDSIRRNIAEDELDPEDILVINPEPLKTRNAVAKARALLLQHDVNSSLAGVTSSADVFVESGSVTFTGVFRAKGNEAAMVYVINAQDCYASFLPGELSKARNRLFTGITRSKAWVRVLGIGAGMEGLEQEYRSVRERNFRLEFIYPNEVARKKLQIVNRDMTRAERERVRKGLGDASSFVDALERGELEVEDLPDEVVERLKRVLGGATRR